MKRIGILTSSRADYGIYLPLLKRLKEDRFFEMEIIAFGMHTSLDHGYTIKEIINDGFEINYQIESMLEGDSPSDISASMAKIVLEFSKFWNVHKKEFDLILCLGDRFEMFSAVISGVPFNMKFAHIHGGESTFGAIDNIFRHSITLASEYHFVSCSDHAKRVAEITETKENIFNIGSLSLENIKTLELLTQEEFLIKYGIDLRQPTILFTFHPETKYLEDNDRHANVLWDTLLELKSYSILITLPNADTHNMIIRSRLKDLSKEYPSKIFCFDNLGVRGYFTAMKYCSFLLGNTSSGIIEAASFGKWVINIGSRQYGRKQSQNTLNVPVDKNKILASVEEIEKRPHFTGENIYYSDNPSKKICSIIKEIL